MAQSEASVSNCSCDKENWEEHPVGGVQKALALVPN